MISIKPSLSNAHLLGFKTILTLLFCTTLLGINSCKKSNLGVGRKKIYLEGYVEHPNGEPAVNAYVFITGGTRHDTVYCDQDGHYEKKYEIEPGTYTIQAYGPSKYYNNIAKDQILSSGDYSKKNFTLIPNCWIRIHAKNVTPVDDLDYIRIYGECFYGSLTPELYGQYADTWVADYRGQYFDTDADQYITIKWQVTKGGVTTTNSDSIYVSAIDTAEFDIKY